MKATLFISSIILFSSALLAEQTIPDYLVGIWASEGAIFEDKILHEGGAVYLDANGLGAYVEGPPAMGSKINATFNIKNNILKLDLIEQTKVVGQILLTYDPKNKALRYHELDKSLYRKHNIFSASTKKKLGI